MSDVPVHDLRALNAIPAALLERTEADLSPYLEPARAIVADVAARGDAALVDLARRHDGVTRADFALAAGHAEVAAAREAVPADVIAAIRYAIDNIRRHHEAQKPAEVWWKEIRPGAYAGERHVALDSIAAYVPRGKGSFPSVAMMTLVPAVVAGVPRIVLVTPPGPDGTVDAATLVVAAELGVTEIYKCGGAAAVAAVAHGTATIPRCDKIVGPGSPWLVAGKRLLAGRIDTGAPAGPSESIVLADESVDGALAALDVVIESEHGPDSSAYLVTMSERVVAEALSAFPGHWEAIGALRAGYSRTVLTGPRGGIVVARDLDQALEFVNAYAPEHLELLVREPHATLGRVRHAGEVLLGPHTPGTLANFVLGPNAVLPTGGAARQASALGVADFMKRMSLGYVTREGYAGLAAPAATLARYEGFPGHERAVGPAREALLGAGGGPAGIR